MTTDKSAITEAPTPFQNLTQSYKVPKDTKMIEITYKPKSLYYGAILSIIGLLLTITAAIIPRKKQFKK